MDNNRNNNSNSQISGTAKMPISNRVCKFLLINKFKDNLGLELDKPVTSTQRNSTNNNNFLENFDLNLDSYKEGGNIGSNVGRLSLNDKRENITSTSRVKSNTNSELLKLTSTPNTKQNNISGSQVSKDFRDKDKEISKIEIIRKMEAKMNIPNFGGTPVGIGSSSKQKDKKGSMVDINIKRESTLQQNNNIGIQDGKGNSLHKRIQKMK